MKTTKVFPLKNFAIYDSTFTHSTDINFQLLIPQSHKMSLKDSLHCTQQQYLEVKHVQWSRGLDSRLFLYNVSCC